MNALESQTVIVTGVGGSIAAPICEVLSAAGAKLVLVGRGEGLQEAGARFGAPTITADLTRPEEATRLADVLASALIHTVGGFAMEKAAEATPEAMRGMFTLNFETLFYTVQAVLPGMLARGRGKLIGISAGQVVRGAGAGAALYTASKAALASYLYALDAELKEQGVRASVIYPMGGVDTPQNRAQGMKPENMIDPRDVADSVLHVLTRSARGHLSEIKVHGAK